MACGLLILVSQVIKRKEDVLIKEMIPSKSLEIKLEDEDTDGEEHYKDVIEEVSGISFHMQFIYLNFLAKIF